MDNRFLVLGLLLLTAGLTAFADNGIDGNGRIDYDLDDDGLIEINDLADLNEIRNNLDGSSLYGADTGCPDDACIGFELTDNLDFDTNSDGAMTASDRYWNDGNGWEPIGKNEDGEQFRAVFDGGGHRINNLMISRPGSNRVGLFGFAENAQLQNLVLAGSLLSVTGQNVVGILAGEVSATPVSNVAVIGSVEGQYSVGGLIGFRRLNSPLEKIVVSGQVKGKRNVGGVVGYSDVAATGLDDAISQVLSTAYVSGDSHVGGLIGVFRRFNFDFIYNSYWATDLSNQELGLFQSEGNNYFGVPGRNLRCTVAADSSPEDHCLITDNSDGSVTDSANLYHEWDESAWDFGTSEQLPTLTIVTPEERDSDGDGVSDSADQFPYDSRISADADNDGYPDTPSLYCDRQCVSESELQFDAFPALSGAWQDADNDGLVDAVNPECAENCDVPAELLDSSLNDFDNDGVVDAIDIDNNNDGVIDVDRDSNGLIEVSSLEQLNLIRHQLDGAGFRSSPGAPLDTSGCPFQYYQGSYQQRCFGYELSSNLDFDSNHNLQIDSGDSFWNAGEGWQPIGSYPEAPFSAVFDGNGFSIKNLMTNRPDENYIGLLGYTKNTEIRNLVLAGLAGSITGGHSTGSLAGSIEDTSIFNIIAANSVRGSNAVGGLIGSLRSKNSLSRIIVTGDVSGDSSVGGVIGSSETNSQTINSITQIVSTAYVSASSSLAGGFLGASYDVVQVNNSAIRHSKLITGSIANSYWASDLSGHDRGGFESEEHSYRSFDLSTLQCPLQADVASESACLMGYPEGDGILLYRAWNEESWDFGTTSELPGLRFNNQVIRDGDGDGFLDGDDAFPDNRAAALDADDDGYPDRWASGCDQQCIENSQLRLDAFPELAGAWRDDDHDGLIDEINTACLENCDVPTDKIDSHLNDFDNDGIPDADDTDDNNSQEGLNVDLDGDGLIEISSLLQLDMMRYQLDGVGMRTSADAELNTSGCPFVVYDGLPQRRCHGYELTQDLDFDSNGDGSVTGADHQGRYWNAAADGIGQGWDPVGTHLSFTGRPFTGVFNGNGFQISNLFINRPNEDYVGLFGDTSDARIENLVLSGSGSFIVGRRYVGTLAGRTRQTDIHRIAVRANVHGHSVAGVVGSLLDSQISVVLASGTVAGPNALFRDTARSNISQVLSSVVASDGRTGFGISGALNNVDTANSYWVNMNNFSDYGTSVENSVLGLSLTSLQCPTAENTDVSHGCLPVEEGNEAKVIFNQWSADYWDFGTSHQLPGLRFEHRIIRDSDGDGAFDEHDMQPFDFDNDGVADADDIYPVIALGDYQDFDSDGAPDECDTACIDLGMAADPDTDGDGVNNTDDAFPRNPAAASDNDNDSLPDVWNDLCDSVCRNESGLTLDHFLNDTDNDGSDNNSDAFVDNPAASVDADNDGYPDVWNDTCVTAQCRDESGLMLDQYLSDTDNDGFVNDTDAFPDNPAAGLDEDNDGLPDAWSTACLTEECRASSGLLLDPYVNDTDNDGTTNINDAFPDHPAAAVDADNDGLADGWNDFCDSVCQAFSGLTLDSQLNDTDNDGVSNDTDQDFNSDNGAPVMLTVAPPRSVAVNNETGTLFIATAAEVHEIFAALTAEDLIDGSSQLSFRAFLGDTELILNDDGGITLPSGLVVIDWIAEDSSGNQSDPMEQRLLVYPKIRFVTDESVVGEASNAEVVIELTGDAPEYPVTVDVMVNNTSSSVEQADLHEAFDISVVQQIVIEPGSDDENLNRQGSLIIPVLEDNLSENDEILVIELQAARDEIREYFSDPLVTDGRQHSLMVTHQNLPPSVELVIEQGGAAVDNIRQDGGMVVIRSVITDPNGDDTHTLAWDLGALGGDTPQGQELSFNPETLAASAYILAVTVTDSGLNPEAVTAEITFDIVAPIEPESPGNSSGGGSGGAIHWLFVLIAIMLLGRQREKHC